MDELDRRGQLEALAPDEAERAREEEDEQRADALAAGADDVVGDLVDQRDLRREPALDDGVDLAHLLGHRRDSCGVGRRGHGARLGHEELRQVVDYRKSAFAAPRVGRSCRDGTFSSPGFRGR